MIIRSIALNNFAVYKGEQVIYLSDGFNGSFPITLVGGLNGRGKTSLLDAVLLNLYGKRSPRIPRGESYSDYLADLISNNLGNLSQEAWVELVLEIPNLTGSTILKVNRSWQIRQVRATDRLSVWQDGHPNEHLSETWDTFIEEQLPSAIAELFFFDGEKISALAESEDTLESLQKAIRSLLGVETVDRLIRNLKFFIRRKQNNMQSSKLYQEFKEAQEQLEDLEQQRVRIKQEQANALTREEHARKQNEELDAQYFALGGGIFAERSKYENQRKIMVNQVNETRAAMVSAASGILPLSLMSDSIKEISSNLKNEEHVKQARYIVSEIESLREMLTTVISNKIPEALSLVQSTIGMRHRQVSDLAEQDIRYNLPSNQVEQALDLIPIEVARASELNTKLNSLQIELEQLESGLTVDLDPVQFEELILQRTKAQYAIEEYIKLRNELETEKSRLTTEITRVINYITDIGNQLAEAEDIERIVKYSIEAREQMQEFRNRLIERKVVEFASSITKQFVELTHKETLVEEIIVDPFTLKISLKGSNSRIIPKSRLSAGERQMLAIAILWGLAKASGKNIPVIIDTPMGRLDSIHRLNFVSKYLPNASHQVVVLSTDTEIEGDYLAAIDPYIGQRYTLEYIESEEATRILSGYFSTPEKDEGVRV